MQEAEARHQIVEAGRRLHERFFVAANDGNISARLPNDEILITPTGVNKGDVTTECILRIDMRGAVLSGSLKPSSEAKMHLAVYRARPEVAGIVHAHPPVATGFAASRIPLDREVIQPEVVYLLRRIGLTDYATPGTEELPRAVEREIAGCEALLLANHGALTVGDDVMQAYYRMEVLEQYARIHLVTRLLGGSRPLDEAQIAAIVRQRDSQVRASASGAAPDVDPGLVETIVQVVMQALKAGGSKA
jgi:L-fuculose-phosphate aldolase